MTEQFTFFWDGPFSQWHRSAFAVDGVRYATAEQYMMTEKARLFGDSKILAEIMKTTSPREQKALGRKVANFDEAVWNAHARDIVYRGNRAKFTQDKRLLDLLLGTKGTTLVEASPYDRIWGIGLRAEDPRAQRRDNWQGKNWLGETLTRLHDDLLRERGEAGRDDQDRLHRPLEGASRPPAGMGPRGRPGRRAADLRPPRRVAPRAEPVDVASLSRIKAAQERIRTGRRLASEGTTDTSVRGR